MNISTEDLRAAVIRGIVTEAQSAQLIALAAARRAAKDKLEPAEEPFVLFKGFNEIFVVVGLTILFTGWIGVATLMGLNSQAPAGFETILLSALTILGLGGVARYFTLKRRMIAPSIALAIMTALSALVLGAALVGNFGSSHVVALVALVVTAVMAGYYAIFRVPFAAAIIAGAVFCALWGAMLDLSSVSGAPFFTLEHGATTSVITLAFGIATFCVAMTLDMSDPMRVSTRSGTAFWLHVVASPAIVNTVALNLLDKSTPGAQGLLVAFLLVIALIAIVIDRRSFLISGAGYSVVLAATLFDGAAPFAILALGLILVLLGSLWDKLRARLMQALPAFPGKTNLPPYGIAE